jgi:thioredoxin-like negative regulator of GroEL
VNGRWCRNCSKIAPKVEKLAQALAGHAIFIAVDIDEVPEVSDRFAVTSVPHFFCLRGGQVRR